MHELDLDQWDCKKQSCMLHRHISWTQALPVHYLLASVSEISWTLPFHSSRTWAPSPWCKSRAAARGPRAHFTDSSYSVNKWEHPSFEATNQGGQVTAPSARLSLLSLLKFYGSAWKPMNIWAVIFKKKRLRLSSTSFTGCHFQNNIFGSGMANPGSKYCWLMFCLQFLISGGMAPVEYGMQGIYACFRLKILCSKHSLHNLLEVYGQMVTRGPDRLGADKMGAHSCTWTWRQELLLLFLSVSKSCFKHVREKE